ncbi:MAG: alpha/beta hydrolase [Trebonia sp.]
MKARCQGRPAPGAGADAAVTRRVIDSLDGPVVLVGHCYGGAVITEAGTHEKRELRQERKIPYPQAGATKERRKQ